MRNFDNGAEYEADLNQFGIELLCPTRRGEALRAGRTVAGARARVGQRVLTLTAAIWHNDAIGAPPWRPCCISGLFQGARALRSIRDSHPDVHVMKRPATAFVLAVVSLILCPILVFIEFTALFGAGMIAYEPANPVWIKALAFVFVVLVGLLALALPVVVIRLGRRARAASRSAGADGSGLATAAVVIGVIVTVGVLAVQAFIAAATASR